MGSCSRRPIAGGRARARPRRKVCARTVLSPSLRKQLVPFSLPGLSRCCHVLPVFLLLCKQLRSPPFSLPSLARCSHVRTFGCPPPFQAARRHSCPSSHVSAATHLRSLSSSLSSLWGLTPEKRATHHRIIARLQEQYVAEGRDASNTKIMVVGWQTRDLFWDRVRMATQFLRRQRVGISKPKIRAWHHMVSKLFGQNGVAERRPIRQVQ